MSHGVVHRWFQYFTARDPLVTVVAVSESCDSADGFGDVVETRKDDIDIDHRPSGQARYCRASDVLDARIEPDEHRLDSPPELVEEVRPSGVVVDDSRHVFLPTEEGRVDSRSTAEAYGDRSTGPAQLVDPNIGKDLLHHSGLFDVEVSYPGARTRVFASCRGDC